MSKKWIIISLIAGAALLTVVLFYSGRNTSIPNKDGSGALSNNKIDRQTGGEKFDYEGIEKEAMLKLGKDTAAMMTELLANTRGRGLKAEAYKAAGNMWDSLHNPTLAAWYYWQSAEQSNDVNTWKLSGRQYFQAMSAVSNPDQNTETMIYLSNRSKEAFKKVLEKNPGDRETTTELGAVYIYSASYNPAENGVMTGVGMLKGVEQQDSMNTKAVYLLGMLSMESKQYDKAKNRFLRLTKTKPGNNPEYPYYYRYLGQAYEALGQNEEAMKSYKAYKKLVENNKMMTQDADALISSLTAHLGHKHE